MSCHVFFAFSTGLKSPLTVPAGTLAACQAHVAHVEEKLGFEATKYGDNPAHWKSTTPRAGVTDEVLCETARTHNEWVHWLYQRFGAWSATPPTGDTESLTPEDAQTFWHGLQEIDVPAARWTADYYRNRMEHVYEVLRGRGSEGVILDARALTEQQAGAVMRILETYLDAHDLRLEVIRGRDCLTDDYAWCEKCGAVDREEAADCRKRGCPVRAEYRDDDADVQP